MPNDFRAASQASFDGRLMTSAHGVTPLRLPLPAGMPAIELIAPRSAGDGADVRKVKESWLADIQSRWTSTSSQRSARRRRAQYLARPNGRQVPDALACPLIFSGKPDAFLEGREDIGVDMLNIDVGALENWIAANAAGRRVDILYITFTQRQPRRGDVGLSGRASDQRGLAALPADRRDGPPGLRAGDYNSAAWQPAAILSDAVTFLSAGWIDAAHAVFPANPTAASGQMWVFAAIAAGHSATPCDYQVAGCAGGHYGGGLENFPRFLEQWSGTQMHYRGSLVSLFQAQRRQPARVELASLLRPAEPRLAVRHALPRPDAAPPGTPVTATVSQIAFRPVY